MLFSETISFYTGDVKSLVFSQTVIWHNILVFHGLRKTFKNLIRVFGVPKPISLSPSVIRWTPYLRKGQYDSSFNEVTSYYFCRTAKLLKCHLRKGLAVTRQLYKTVTHLNLPFSLLFCAYLITSCHFLFCQMHSKQIKVS